jgi:hypothetical protein
MINITVYHAFITGVSPASVPFDQGQQENAQVQPSTVASDPQTDSERDAGG